MIDTRQPPRQAFALKRLAWVIRKAVLTQLDEAPGVNLDIVAQETASQLYLWIKAEILGLHKSARIELEAPAGRFDAFLYALGLPYRKKRITVDTFCLFPDLPAERDNMKVYLELASNAGSVDGYRRLPGD
jgi:hypothetical protein